MPAIIDREQMRCSILEALERCAQKKPLFDVSLRDIAEEAGMSHTKVLYYYDSREEIIRSYIKYTRDYMTEKCLAWFEKHRREDYASNLEYMNAFMRYVAEGQEGEKRPGATTQTYVYGHFDNEIGELVREEYCQWRTIMEQCLRRIYGDEVGAKEAEAMMILIAGTFICNYNGALTGGINSDIISLLSNLAKS